jgi:hypothetical protein
VREIQDRAAEFYARAKDIGPGAFDHLEADSAGRLFLDMIRYAADSAMFYAANADPAAFPAQQGLMRGVQHVLDLYDELRRQAVADETETEADSGA